MQLHSPSCNCTYSDLDADDAATFQLQPNGAGCNSVALVFFLCYWVDKPRVVEHLLINVYSTRALSANYPDFMLIEADKDDVAVAVEQQACLGVDNCKSWSYSPQ